MVKPGEKRPAQRQKIIVDLFQKPAKTTRGISDRSKTPSFVVGQNNELSPSLPGENNELSPSSVVGQNNELSPSLPGENIELSPPLPGENNELSPSSVVASCPLVVGENPTFSSSKPQSDTKLPKASTLSNWRLGDGVKPLKATGTRWIDHRIRAMGRLVDKFGLYTRHLKEFIDAEKKSKVRATVTGKLDKILDAQVLLRSAFLKDLVTPANIFSLVTQKQDPNVMETVEAVEKTSRNYKKLLRKFKRDNNQVFELPTLKAVISEMEGNNELDGEPMYQGQRLKYNRRGKQYIADHCVYLVESIINCYNERYWFDEEEEEKTNGDDVTTNDHLVFHICKVLNASTWPKLPNDDSNDDNILRTQLQSVSRVYAQFSAMEVFKHVDKDSVIDGYVEVVRFCQRYLDYENSNQVELWHKVLLQCKDKPEWHGIGLVIEICLCTPCSNATLERFFNQLKIVKTDQRTALSSSSLNSILRIKLRQIPLKTFHDEFADKVVSHWCNEKGRRVHQKQRKGYKKKASSVKSRKQFDIAEFTLDDPSSDDSRDEIASSDSSDDDMI